MARIQLAEGAAGQAAETARTARQALDNAPDELESARLHALFAEALIASGNPDLAKEHVEHARQVFERLGAAFDLKGLVQVP
jgi:hypothetical protein